ncbi:hypothetical protein HY003_02125 [Candidatus Saccharibacteria bacterium]|nr:hypothetical protein [Candidatus Saccharibacteria bacterium]MBI3338073.1 hypothetical protein [Candidatus Saccharibacteria bacterium]
MTISGLLNKPQTPEGQLYLAGTPDIAEAIGVTLDAYRELGYTPNVDDATRTMTEDFNSNVKLGYNGRLFVPAPQEVSFDQLLAAAEGKRPKNVQPIYRYANLWTPGTEPMSYTDEDLNQAPIETVGRIALFNADTNTGLDPILHHPDTPYDYKHAKLGEATQLQKITKDIAEFEAKHTGYNLLSLDHRDFALLALMDRIRGVKKVKLEDQILSKGIMRTDKLGRRSVDGGSVVGDVYSYVGRLDLRESSGGAYPYTGVGLSAEPTKV